MSLRPILSTPVCPANRYAGWELAATGVEFTFMGSYGFQGQVLEIINRQDCADHLHLAGSKPNKRSGRYR